MLQATTTNSTLPTAQGAIAAQALPKRTGAQMSVVEHLGDGLRTAGESLGDMAEGLVKMAGTGLRTYADLSVMSQVMHAGLNLAGQMSGRKIVPHEMLPNPARGVETIRSAGASAAHMATHPMQVVDAIKKPYEDAWSAGRYGALAGLAAVDLGDLAFGSHGAGKAGKLSVVAEAVAKVGEKAADASQLAQVTHGAQIAADAAGAAIPQARVRMDLRDVNALLREIRTSPQTNPRPQTPEPAPRTAPERPRVVDQTHTTSGPERSHVPGAIQAIHGQFRNNTATWHLNAKGEPVRATAVLREAPTGVKRTGSEKAAQRAASDAGLYDNRGRKMDNAGHIIGHRYIANQGAKNMFPQNIHFNGAVYGSMEVEWEHWINSKPGRYVEVQVDLVRTNGQHRPDRVKVDYAVREADGSVVFENALRFTNDAHATYTAVRNSAMRSYPNASTRHAHGARR